MPLPKRENILSRKFLALCLIGLVGLFEAGAAVAQKTDLVHLQNGDRITGEIKELVRGQMRINTDPFGEIFVKWEDVDRIETDKELQVELVNGRRYFGVLAEESASGFLPVVVRDEVINLGVEDIIYIQAFKEEKRFGGNLDAKLAAGLSYTQASDVTRWNINASINYREEKYVASATYDSIITNNGQGKDATSRDLTFGYSRLRRNLWFLLFSGSYQENDELGVDGRVIARAGLGRVVSQSQRHELSLVGGLAGNLENALGEATPNTPSSESLEGLLIAEWSYFRFYTPKSDINLRVDLYPSITESERLRGNLRLQFRHELVKKLYWNINYFYNFDTDPPAGALSDQDSGIVTSFEYEF